jgi:hypothetical protein
LDPNVGEGLVDSTSGKDEPARIYLNFIFRNTHIVYRGKFPIELINVFFDNCTFELPNTDRGRLLADKVLKETHLTFKGG